VVLRDGYAYVADGEGGLQIVSIASPEAPVVVGSLLLPGFAVRVALAGDCAYVANLETGLQVVDISNPAAPRALGGLDTSNRAQSVAVTSGGVAVVEFDNALVMLPRHCGQLVGR
jgi:hypothetical protein